MRRLATGPTTSLFLSKRKCNNNNNIIVMKIIAKIISSKKATTASRRAPPALFRAYVSLHFLRAYYNHTRQSEPTQTPQINKNTIRNPRKHRNRTISRKETKIAPATKTPEITGILTKIPRHTIKPHKFPEFWLKIARRWKTPQIPGNSRKNLTWPKPKKFLEL